MNEGDFLSQSMKKALIRIKDKVKIVKITTLDQKRIDIYDGESMRIYQWSLKNTED